MKRIADMTPRAMADAPSTNGRTLRGQFARGNPGGPGNPYARRTAALRSALLDAVTEADIRAIAKALVKRARDGEVPAVRELLDRLLGRPGDVQELSAPTEIRVITGVSEREYHEEAAALVTGIRRVRSLGDGGRS
jgi:hypothetical protein